MRKPVLVNMSTKVFRFYLCCTGICIKKYQVVRRHL